MNDIGGRIDGILQETAHTQIFGEESSQQKKFSCLSMVKNGLNSLRLDSMYMFIK